jgi:glycosyltransferase involved in cell wall biosynthesis
VNAPLVSVIVPARDAGLTIGDTLESVCGQTVTDLEVIVIDDGSTDDTVGRVSAVADGRIAVASFPGRGLSTARNRGLARARGAYLSFIDADDLWTADKLELQLEALRRRPDAGAAYSWTYDIDPAGHPIGPHPPVRHEGNVYAPMLLGNFVGSGSNVLLRRAVIETVGEFDPALPAAEDWDYFLRAAARWPFAVAPRYQVLYRQSPHSLSSRIDTMREQVLRVAERAFAAAPPDLQHLKPRSLANVHCYVAWLALTRAAGTEGAERARQSLAAAVRLDRRLALSSVIVRLWLRWALVRFVSPRTAEWVAALARSRRRGIPPPVPARRLTRGAGDPSRTPERGHP